MRSDYNSELSLGASEARFAEIRAMRRQRQHQRNEQPQRGNSLSSIRNHDPYNEMPEDDDIFAPRPKGSYAKVLLTQAVVCALLLGFLFLVTRAMPNTYRQLHRAYEQMMQTDMSAREVFAAARGVFGSLRDEIYVVAPQGTGRSGARGRNTGIR